MRTLCLRLCRSRSPLGVGVEFVCAKVNILVAKLLGATLLVMSWPCFYYP